MNNTNNQGALADLLQGRMQEIYSKSNSRPVLELGTITADRKLQVDGLPQPIEEFMVSRHLTYGDKDKVLTKTAKDGIHTHNQGGAEIDQQQKHVHEVLIPEKMQRLQPNDRVLVAWVINIPIILAVVVDKSKL